VNEVQILVDSLAARLGRPAGVDDRRFGAIAYSSHPDEVDPVRRTSILGRRAPAEVTDWLRELGVMQAHGVLRVPANPAFDMVARVCVPVRFHDRLLGFLWLAEGDQPLGDDELAACERSAADLAQALWRQQRLEDAERQAEAAELRDLLAPGGPPASARIAPAGRYAVLVAAAVCAPGQPPPAGLDVRLGEAVDRLRRSVPPRHELADVGQTEATVAVAADGAEELDARAATLLAAAQAELADVTEVRVVVGVGDPVERLSDLADSWRQARVALSMGRTMARLGPLVRWSGLGVLRLLGELVGDRDPASLIPPPVRRLVADPDGRQLAETLEAYLDHGGDVAAAAAELYVHRSSLYNRLRRIEDVAGVDVRSGADRLELHLGLRLWRMSEGR
jgi:hypothetical protein